eukprot:TRINITY_DN73789_c0_g1_i1.p1 TRINITY_DN73789_c0_g1~~TRINITY_DN73789_c0_g1_i1.p1  ORF type:complete len:309 (+),score=25.81 TRINITY_DN73789_c0_g1_i1:75-1001(+)
MAQKHTTEITIASDQNPVCCQRWRIKHVCYDDDELRLKRHIQITDLPGLMFLGIVVLLSGDLYRSQPLPQGFSSMIRTRTTLCWIAALLAAHALYLNFYAQPYPSRASSPVYKVIGRNVFLTRHCIVLQFVHLTFSAIAETSTIIYHEEPPIWLLNMCYGNALFVGALACFVTVQYFNLVSPTPEFKEDCALWESRGVPQKWIQDQMHLWGLPLTFFDLLVVKQRGMLVARMPYLYWIMIGIALFTIYYLALIHLNYLVTGAWPYEILSHVNAKGARGWLTFWVVQTGILIFFMVTACVPVIVLPALV